MFDRNDKRPWLWIILGGAFIIRLTAAVCVQQWVELTPNRFCLIAGDAEGYWELAQKLARGEEYAIYDPPRRVERMPGFPLLLAAGIKVFGTRILWLRILLAGVGTTACGLVYGLACELFDRSIALRACLLAAVFPTFVVFSVMFLSETLFAAMLVGSLWAIANLVKTDSASVPPTGKRALALVSGVLMGLATLVRPTWLLVGPGFVTLYILMARNRPQAVVQGALLLTALGATMLPWTIRNWQVTGKFVPTTLWVGPSLYDGLHPQASGASDMRFVERDGFYNRLSEYDADRHYRAAAMEFVRTNPGRAAQLAFIKLARFWNPAPNAEQFGHWAIRWGVVLSTLPLWALALSGGWQARGASWSWLIPAAPLAYFTLVHVVFIGSVRYRLPAEYPLVVLSAAGWSA